jgi:hypothetical protein
MIALFYVGIVSAIVLYANTVALVKKAVNKEDTSTNTIIGCVGCAIIVACILSFAAYK